MVITGNEAGPGSCDKTKTHMENWKRKYRWNNQKTGVIQMSLQSFFESENSHWMFLEQQPSLQTENQSIATVPKLPEKDCHTVHLLNGKIAITVPLVLRCVPLQTQTLKTRRDVTLEDEKRTVKLTLTHLYQKVANEGEVFEYQNQVKQALKRLNPSMEWLLGGIKEVNGMRIPFFEVITESLGMEVYNLNFFLLLQKRVVSGKFICGSPMLKQWRPIIHQILDSVEVRKFEKKAFRNIFQVFT